MAWANSRAMINHFRDGMGQSREAYFRKIHEGHDGLHRYRTVQVAYNCNEITKWWWVATHWAMEARFFRMRASPSTLIDYNPQEFQKLLRGQKANFMRIHQLVYQGPYYTANWGAHELTVTVETKPNLGFGYVYKNAMAHESEQFGEYSYSWIDRHPIRVIRQSIVL